MSRWLYKCGKCEKTFVEDSEDYCDCPHCASADDYECIRELTEGEAIPEGAIIADVAFEEQDKDEDEEQQ